MKKAAVVVLLLAGVAAVADRTEGYRRTGDRLGGNCRLAGT